MIIDKESKVQCGCGMNGCLETFCSVKRLKQAISNELKLNYIIKGTELVEILNIIYELDGKKINNIDSNEYDTFEILKLLNDENINMIKSIYEAYKENLIVSLINIINIFDPERISIGGSLSYFIERDLEDINKKVNERCIYKEYGNDIQSYKIVKAKLENDAGLIGAAMMQKYV